MDFIFHQPNQVVDFSRGNLKHMALLALLAVAAAFSITRNRFLRYKKHSYGMRKDCNQTQMCVGILISNRAIAHANVVNPEEKSFTDK